MTTRMTAPRLARLIADGDVEAVRTAVTDAPRLLDRTVERAGQGGWTPLHVAVAEGQEEIVRLLVKAGADLSATTEHDRTPLHLALECCPGLVAVLRELGASVDAASAAFLDDAEELGRALDRGAALVDPATGTDLLSFAAAGGSARTARLLLDRGADADGGALQAAAGGGHVDLVAMLLAAGADADRRDPDTGRAPLHAAVAAGPDGDVTEVVRRLLAAGADVNATTNDGASALDISRVAAARSRRGDAGRATASDALSELLVSHGATD
jgi:ankyrin repeat protein